MALEVYLTSPEWKSRVFDSNNITVNGGTFAIDAGAEYTDEWVIFGKTVTWNFSMIGTSGSTPTNFEIKVPGSKIIDTDMIEKAYVSDAGTDRFDTLSLSNGADFIVINKLNGGVYGNGDFQISFSVTFKIQ